MKRLIFMAGALLALAGCAMGANVDARREALSRQIADDAASFNQAYGQAVSAQILLNVLRGRDRLPRYYLAMTGISDSPSVRQRQNAGVGGVPLGEGGSPWGFGNFGVERETQSRPSYAVQPFDAATLTRTAFEPTAPYVFEHYWRSGWPRDILLLLMVERIETVGPNGERRSYQNEANEIFEDCAESVTTNGCAFVREVRTFLAASNAPQASDALRPPSAICGLVEAYGAPEAVRRAAPEGAPECDPVFVIGQTRVTMHLRSLDDVIYYVGELMRVGSMDAGGGAIEAQVSVRAAGLRGGGVGVPLFRIVPAAAARGDFAATVEYGGARYFAGPAIGRSCGAATPDGPCRDDAAHGDRSSSVLSLIAELMALNQSPEAIRAPSRLIAE
jgi:hypothetical protein